MNKINSLYELIKKTSQEKGRPLKIICDWDDTLQPVRPMVIYNNTVSKLESSFEEFCERFYENSILTAFPSKKSEIGEYHNYPQEKQAVELFEKKRFEEPEKRDYKGIENFYQNNNYYTSIASELILAIKSLFRT